MFAAMKMRPFLRSVLIPLALSLPAAAATTGGNTASQPGTGKIPPRKAPDTRERKRTSQSSVARGCVGCISPLDGISSTMAVRTLD